MEKWVTLQLQLKMLIPLSQYLKQVDKNIRILEDLSDPELIDLQNTPHQVTKEQ